MFTATRPLYRGGMPGFWARSMEEFKRQAGIAIRLETLKKQEKAYPFVQFTDAGSIDRCKVMCDSDAGGFSRASLTFHQGAAHIEKDEQKGLIVSAAGRRSSKGDGEEAEPSHAQFKGTISNELPPNRPDIQRSGYAAWRTRDRGLSLFGRLLWDTDPYAFLALRIKSDGRKYFVNIQTESIVPTDLHQHLLPCQTPGEWETVAIPFLEFVRTNHGMVVEPQKEMLRQKVRSVGIGLIDRVPGPFEISVADIYATNRPPPRVTARRDSGFDLGPRKEDVLAAEREAAKREREKPEEIMI